ncbi:MAG: hypothetical protein E6K55_11305 [Gemmatimonadetes bacterium]|nr:MAG: hypothetical protein DMD67_12745 [Gemmatimonadota bacterium]TLY50635.1 MAG: hypothetical protein E6K55_11305 [Gemmatimonadota bacterium]
MPVTAKLSRKFYEKLGDDLTNELVEWFNQVDAAYRTELRELNDLNFGRFEAKLEALESRLEARMAVFEARIIKWMFLFWIGQAVTTVGLVFGVGRLTGR